MIDEMEFTTDWVTPREAWWREIFWPLANTPARMLEVGFYEGRSAQWWLRNVLTHPESSLVCVDRWASKGKANRERILADPAHGAKIACHEEDAIVWAARQVGAGSAGIYDAVYSDFSKEAGDIMTLSCLAWRMLKPGGIYLWDDYTWRWTEESGGPAPPERGPDVGVDAWIAAHEPFCSRIEHRCGQVAAWKRV